MVDDLDSTEETADEMIFESAEMLADRSIKWLSGYLNTKDKVSPGHDAGICKPGSPDYDRLMTVHKLTEPGQSNAITKRLINGAWVEVIERNDSPIKS
jgi:hypothetical protein